MYKDERLRELYRSDSTDKNLMIEFSRPGRAPFLRLWDNSHILSESIVIEESLSSSENLDFGSCEATQISLTLIDVEQNIKGAEMTVYQTLDGVYPEHDLYPGADTYPSGYIMPLGRYIVKSAERQEKRRYRDIVALDYMSLFDVNVIDWYNAIPFPLTIRDFRARLCRHIGVTEHVPDYLPNDNLLISKTIDAAELLGRDVLIACEQLNGVFGHFDRHGVLQHIALQPNYSLVPAKDLLPAADLYPVLPGVVNDQVYDERVGPHLRISCRFEEYTVQSIDKVQVRQEDGDIGAIYGAGTNCLTVEGNFLAFGKSSDELRRIAMGIYGMVNGRQYIPYECNLKGLPYMEVGDTELLDFDGESIVSYIIKRTLKGIYALKDTHSATGEEIRSTENNINTEIMQLKGKSAKIVKTVEEVSVTVADLESRTSAQLKVVSDQILAEVKRATEQEVEIAGSISVMAGQIEAKVSRGDLVAAINLEANKTGSVITMKAGHFIFEGSNFWVDAAGAGGLAGGNFTWDKNGNLVAKGMKLDGTANTSSIGADVINCNHLEVQDALECNGGATISGPATFNGNLYANQISCHSLHTENQISCYSIYSEMAGSTWSDKRLKKGIKDIAPETALSVVLGLKSVEYRTKYSNARAMGFVAQDVVKLLHKLGVDLPMVDRYNGYLALQYQNAIPLLAGAIQALADRIEGQQEVSSGK